MWGKGRDGSRIGAESRIEEPRGTNGGTENRHFQVVWAIDCHLR